jgi:hypothetical protein
LADEFAQNWNFLCDLQGPATSESGLDRVDQDLDDVKDFVEDGTSIKDHSFEVLDISIKSLKRKT